MDRTDLEEFKRKFANAKPELTLDKALKDADVFVGLSVGNVVTADMVKSMAKNPIVFAMANPDPEISWEEATGARKDVIMATGRSDYPNQVNNVLGFPYIFRGALDVRATQINEAMKLAAVKALAELAQSPVPDIVNLAYNTKTITFGAFAWRVTVTETTAFATSGAPTTVWPASAPPPTMRTSTTLNVPYDSFLKSDGACSVAPAVASNGVSADDEIKSEG